MPVGRLAKIGRCGACKAPLGPLAEPINADHSSLSRIISEAQVPILVDFSGRSKLGNPEIDALAREMAGRALVLKVDIEAQPELAVHYQVQSAPAVALFYGGVMSLQHNGAAPLAEMRQWLEHAAARGLGY